MSTPVIPPPGAPAPGTPTPPQTAAEIAAANAVSQSTPTPGNPPPAAPPAPPAAVKPTADNPVVTTDIGGGKFRVEYFTGETFEGTPQEVATKQGQAHVNTKLWAQKNQPPPTPQPPTPPPSKFSDPAEEQAAEYAAGLVARRLGYNSVAEMESALGRISETSTEFASQNMAVKFQTIATDFNETPENSERLFQEIGETVSNDVWNQMSQTQQIRLMAQAHSRLIQLGPQNGGYAPKPAGTAQVTRPTVIPPPPSGAARPEAGGVLPQELQANITDTAEQIRAKWEKAKAMGLA